MTSRRRTLPITNYLISTNKDSRNKYFLFHSLLEKKYIYHHSTPFTSPRDTPGTRIHIRTHRQYSSQTSASCAAYDPRGHIADKLWLLPWPVTGRGRSTTAVTDRWSNSLRVNYGCSSCRRHSTSPRPFLFLSPVAALKDTWAPLTGSPVIPSGAIDQRSPSSVCHRTTDGCRITAQDVGWWSLVVPRQSGSRPGNRTRSCCGTAWVGWPSGGPVVSGWGSCPMAGSCDRGSHWAVVVVGEGKRGLVKIAWIISGWFQSVQRWVVTLTIRWPPSKC